MKKVIFSIIPCALALMLLGGYHLYVQEHYISKDKVFSYVRMNYSTEDVVEQVDYGNEYMKRADAPVVEDVYYIDGEDAREWLWENAIDYDYICIDDLRDYGYYMEDEFCELGYYTEDEWYDMVDEDDWTDHIRGRY